MIDKKDMFEPMLTVCPTFEPAWREFCDEWEDEKEDLPFYLALGDLARHLVERLKAGETDQFGAIFDVIERWHCEGDPYVSEAATIGLLEGIQNIAGDYGLDPTAFEPWLRPESKKWWNKLNRFWGGETGALSKD